jgi:ADP-dependent NAD(P)H-hydrate dehydratase / NAD(P)H-hydrate epimerase
VCAYAVADVRQAEEAAMARLPDGALMQRAAAGLAAVVVRLLEEATGGVYGRRVVLLIGAGNNGGDALWAGARLAARGAHVQALLTGDRVHEGGLAALRAAGGTAVGVDKAELPELLGKVDVVVDGLLGIGGRAGLRGLAATLADAVGELPGDVPVVAVDLPSGVDPDTGEAPGSHVRATHTVTFGVLKPCLLLPPARHAAGEVVLVDIGLEPYLDATGSGPAVAAAATRTGTSMLAARWPVPGPDDDKYRRGVVGVVAGGQAYTGAAVLAVGAAVVSGAGMVRYVGPDEPSRLVRASWPEVVPGDGRVQAWVLGPGLDPDADDGRREAVRRALAGDLPCVVDAGALALLPSRRDAPTLLTPHAGELARLLSERGEQVERADVEAAPLQHARRAAQLTGATVLLKGATAVICDAVGIARARDDGPHWLATAGSGDVLAGLLGTLLAAGLPTHVAAEAGVAVHGLAGEIASSTGLPDDALAWAPGGPVTAGSVLAALPAAIATLLAGQVPPGRNPTSGDGPWGARRLAGRPAQVGAWGPWLREWRA